MKPIRLAIYSGEIPSTTFIERLIEALAAQNFEVMLFGRIKETPQYTSSNINVIGSHDGMRGILQTLMRLANLRLGAPSHFKKLKEHLGFGPFSSANSFRKWQVHVPVVLHLPDIFHIQWAKSVQDWIYLKEKFGVKIVLSLRGTHITISPLVDNNLARCYKDVFPHIDSFHSVSESILEEALQYGIRKDMAHIIYSGLEDITPKELKQRNQPLKLISVGRFHWLKGYQYLFDALVILKKLKVEFKFTLVAHGDLPEELLFQLHDLNLKDDVIWIKGLPHHEVMHHMSEHDALILPSLQEGIANVVLEAMNIGLPVISTDCGGMDEVIQDGVNGFLVPIRNPKALADAITKFNALSTDEIERIRMHALATIERQFNMKNNIKDFEELYKKVVA